MEYSKVKFEANHGRNWAKSTKYASCTSSQLYFISLLSSYQLEVQDQIKNKCKRTPVKSDFYECKTSLECRKVRCGANRNKNWAKSTKYASCTSRR